MLSVQKRCKRQPDGDKCDKLEHNAGYVTARKMWQNDDKQSKCDKCGNYVGHKTS